MSRIAWSRIAAVFAVVLATGIPRRVRARRPAPRR